MPWLGDDKGACGGLGDGTFVIAGDMNADPLDGDARPDSISQLLTHPRTAPDAPPRSEGAVALAEVFKLPRRGETAEKTAVFGPKVGTLRLDYILPSRDVEVIQKGVFWPEPSTPDEPMTRASDPHAVWLDLRLARAVVAPAQKKLPMVNSKTEWSS